MPKDSCNYFRLRQDDNGEYEHWCSLKGAYAYCDSCLEEV